MTQDAPASVLNGGTLNGGNPRRAGHRLRQLHSSHRFGIVLLLVVATCLFVAFAPDEPWTLSVTVLLQSVTLGVALWTGGLSHHGRSAALAVMSVGAGGALAQQLLQTQTSKGGLGLMAGTLAIATVVITGLGVFQQGTVNMQSVRGAISIYLLVGLTFSFLYGAVATLDSDPLFAQGTDGTSSLRLYFSFVTMTTVGYGDYSAATTLGRTLAVTEALIGQLYLVTVIATIVSQIRPGQNRRES